MFKKNIVWGEKKYYSDYKDNHFMKTIIFREKKIKNNYNYVPNWFVRFFRNLFYYLFAYPILWIFMKCKLGVKVTGRKNIKKVKGGAILIGNHTHAADGCLASVYVAFPKRNYIITKKDAVEVIFAKHITKTLGALPLPDEPKGLANLSKSIDFYLKRGNTVTIFPEACCWPNYTKLRPLAPANFHYAVKSNVPIIPFCVTYRYAKGKNYLKKKPKINLTILEPIYPDTTLSPQEAKNLLAKQTEDAMRKVIETKDNVAFYDYVKVSKEELEEIENKKSKKKKSE